MFVSAGLKLFSVNVFKDQDKEYVGFATLPNQVHRKSVKKGFAFTLMVAGEDLKVSQS